MNETHPLKISPSGLMGRALAPDQAIQVQPSTWALFVFLGKRLYSHSPSLQASVYMGPGEFNAGVNPAMG